MSGLSHLRGSREDHFHSHPFHGVFALVASFLLAVLLMLLLVQTAK